MAALMINPGTEVQICNGNSAYDGLVGVVTECVLGPNSCNAWVEFTVGELANAGPRADKIKTRVWFACSELAE